MQIGLILFVSSIFISSCQAMSNREKLENGLSKPGHYLSHANGVYQLRVDPQPNNNADCGYHALKNVLVSFKFIQNPMPKMLMDFTKALVYADYWQKWKTILSTSTTMIPGFELSISDVFQAAPGEMLSAYAEEILKNADYDPYRNDIYLCGDLHRSAQLTQAIYNNEVNLVDFTLLTTLNTHLNKLQNPNTIFGFVFSDSPQHWIALTLANVDGKKFAFCFDSLNNTVKTSHPAIMFIAESFFSNQENALLKKYFTNIVPQLTQYFNELAGGAYPDQLVKLMSGAGIATKGHNASLAIITAVPDMLNQQLTVAFNEVLRASANPTDFGAALKGLIDRWEKNDDLVWKNFRNEKLKKAFERFTVDVTGKRIAQDATDEQVTLALKSSTVVDLQGLQHYVALLNPTTDNFNDKLTAVRAALEKLGAHLSALKQKLIDLKNKL